MDRLKSISLYIFFGLLAYMPLHILLSTWIGSSLQILEFAKIAKDIVLVLGALLILAASARETWFKDFLRDKLVWLIVFYALLTAGMAAIKPTDADAEVLGVVYNLRFLVFFLYAGLLAQTYRPQWLRRHTLQIVLSVGLVVMIFGFVQYMWLTDTALSHIGYTRENGVLPAFHIDNKLDLERIHSTLRDPNSYGAYLLILLAIVFTKLLVNKNKDLQKILFGMCALALLNIYFTFSRSAWIGAVLTIATVLALIYQRGHRIKVPSWAWVSLVVAVIIMASSLFIMRDSYFVKNVILHADESTVLEDPNQLRVRFIRESLDASLQNPLGHGPGTAGLASIRNDKQGVVLNENYYLQILYELGILGMIIFISILGWVFLRLFRNTSDWLNITLIAALIGISFTNLFVHNWANEALACTWWALAGVLVFAKMQNSRKSKPTTHTGNTHNKKEV